MTLIKEFVKKVLSNTGSFSLNIKEDNKKDISNYHFLQDTIGKARYIYGLKKWNDDKAFSDISLKPELVAIVSDEIVYIVNEFFLQTVEWPGHEVLLSENVIRFNDLIKAKNESVSSVIFPAFYASLEVEDITEKQSRKPPCFSV